MRRKPSKAEFMVARVPECWSSGALSSIIVQLGP